MKLRSLYSALQALPDPKDPNRVWTLRQVVILLFVLDRGETTSPEIEAATGVPQGRISDAVKILVVEGLVESYRGGGPNGRRNTVIPTEAGKALAAQLEALR